MGSCGLLSRCGAFRVCRGFLFPYKSERSEPRMQNESMRYKVGRKRNRLHGLHPRYLYTIPGLPSPRRSLVRQPLCVLNVQGKHIGAADIVRLGSSIAT